MAEKNSMKDQYSRPMEDENGRKIIPLSEKAERLKQAECIARGGTTYKDGVCYK